MNRLTNRAQGLISVALKCLVLAGLLVQGGCVTKSIQPRKASSRAMMESVLALYNQGAAAAQAGEWSKAREQYQAALELASALGDEVGIANSLAALGAIYGELKEYSRSLEFLTAALPYFVKSGNLAGEALTLAAIGGVHYALGHDSDAIEAINRALAIEETLLAKALPQEKPAVLGHRASALYVKAGAQARLGQFAEATESYRGAATDFQLVESPEQAGTSLFAAADVSRTKMKKAQQALELFSESWRLLKVAGKPELAMEARNGQGFAYLDMGNFREAARIFADVVEWGEARGLSALVASGYLGLGVALDSLSEFEQALSNYQAALQWLRRGGSKGNLALEPDILYLKGRIHRRLSQYEEAIEHFRAAAVRYRETKQAEGEGEALTQLAEVSLWLVDIKASTQFYEQALKVYEATGNLPKQVEALAALGAVSFAGGETSSDEANKYFEDGRRLLAEFEGIDWFARWKERSAKRKLSSEEEKEFFQDWFRALPSLNAEHRMAAGIFYQKWGRVFLAAKQLGTAVDLLQQAFIYHASLPPYLESAFEQAKDLFFFAEASRQRGEHTLALQALRRAENLAASLRSPEIHWIYAGLARTYADLGDADKAMLFYEKGLAMLESIQHQQGNEEIKIGVLEGALYAYRGFINLLLNLYWKTSEERYLQQAFQVNERLRARVFLDMLAKSRATRLGGEVQWLAAEEEQIRRQVDRIHHQLRTFNKMDKAEETRLLDQLEALREKWRSLQRQAAQQSQRYQQIFFPRPVTVPEVQSALGADTALLEYSTAREGSTLWVITKDQFHAYTLPSEEGLPVLEAFLKTVREPLMGSNEVSQHVQLGQTMYRALLGPAEGQLRGKNHLVVVPDGPLYYLPFEALIIPERAGNETRYKGLAEVPYLVKQFGVSYVPSASILVTQRGKRNPIGKLWQLPLVAFGDPIYNEGVGAGRSDIETARLAHLVLRGGNLNRLEFSGEEVRRIAQIWDIPLNSEHINLGTRASVERLHELDLSRYRILHFATHGLLADEVGWATQPALVLSQSANSYGLLQFADILELKLNAELVVLSACNTSLGRLREAEGIVGLTRAFQYAGASAVVVSLWKVEDQSTSLLMEQFNLRLKKGESKAEALRRAKLEVLQSTIDLKALGMSQALASPFYWAPFILFGDWE